MDGPARHRCQMLSSPALGLALLLTQAARGDVVANYTAQVIARQGDKAGDVIFTDFFGPWGLNDNGQLVFETHQANHRDALIQYSDGRFTPVALAGGPAPGGKTWPSKLEFWVPVSMNEAGDIVFDPAPPPNGNPYGVWLWDHSSQQLTDVADKGTPVLGDLKLDDAGGYGWASINNRGEIALAGYFNNSTGYEQIGVLLRSASGQFQEVALPGSILPGGGPVIAAFWGNINDAGSVAFSAYSTRETHDAAYLCENDSISVIADRGTEIPGYGKIVGAAVLGFNNSGSALIRAQLQSGGPVALFLWNQGHFTQVAVPGQDMPGGGKYMGMEVGVTGSAAGAFSFLGQVEENDVIRTAAYMVGADGKVSLILKTGMTTNLGTITGIGTSDNWGIGLNSQMQVALPVQIYDGPDTLVLLTPKGG